MDIAYESFVNSITCELFGLSKKEKEAKAAKIAEEKRKREEYMKEIKVNPSKSQISNAYNAALKALKETWGWVADKSFSDNFKGIPDNKIMVFDEATTYGDKTSYCFYFKFTKETMEAIKKYCPDELYKMEHGKCSIWYDLDDHEYNQFEF